MIATHATMLHMVKKWKKLEKIANVKSVRRMAIDKQVFLRPDGKRVSWFIRSGEGKVVVCALTKEKKIVLIQQFRHGIDSIDIGLASGGFSKGETALACAKRELKEETGYSSHDWIALGKHAISAGNSAGWQYSFLALECVEGVQELEADEYIDVLVVSKEELQGYMAKNKIHDSGPLLALHLAKEEVLKRFSYLLF